MQPTATEKLIVEMLCKIYKKLEITDSYDPDIVARAIGSHDYWVLDVKYGLRDGDGSMPPHVAAVSDTLEMYHFLQESFAEFDEDQIALISQIGLGTSSEFPGYDGDTEVEYSRAARYLVSDLNRFTSLNGSVSANSHAPLAPMYARMVEEFLPIRSNLKGRKMTHEEFIKVWRAAIHPNNR